MNDRKIKDLTVGNPLKLIIEFAIPIFLGMLFQQFYSVMDTVIVGKTLGVEALAAVGATGSITFLIIGFCNGIASGFAIPVAQRFGARDEKGLKLAIANSVYLGIALSVLITVLVTALCRKILVFLNTPSDILEDSHAYLIVILWGIPITFFYNLFSGFMRSMGDSKTPVLFLVLASVINIVLDFVFIAGLKTGVEGAAYATVISQLLAAVLSNRRCNGDDCQSNCSICIGTGIRVCRSLPGKSDSLDSGGCIPDSGVFSCAQESTDSF